MSARLQQRVAEKAVGRQIAVGQLLLLILVGRHALQPAERRDHREQQVQLGMLGHARLDEQRRLRRIDARRASQSITMSQTFCLDRRRTSRSGW